MASELPETISFFISEFRKTILQTADTPRYFTPRSYRNAAIRFRNCRIEDYEERYHIAINKAFLNVFKFPANKIPGCDLLSDSGTTTMTMEQWSQILLGDEAYGSNEGYYELKDQVAETFGEQWRKADVYIFHQGRACEHALFKALSDQCGARSKFIGKDPYFIIPNNGHFDTTEANVRDNNIEPVNLFCPDYYKEDSTLCFKGDIDTDALEKLVSNETSRIPVIYLTITNNTGGGQPVSMKCIKEVNRISRKYKTPFFFDAARFAENAWFIQKYEKGYDNKNIIEIFKEMFSFVDGFHISCKKDGLVNIGGMLVIKHDSLFTEKYPQILDALTDHQILTEAHPTYGGLAGRDLKGLVEGFKTVARQEYLDFRIQQVRKFGEALSRNGVPVLQPFGGHAVYIKVDDFFKDVPDADEHFKGVGLTSLLLIGGHRLCELGVFAFGRMKDGIESPPSPRVNYIRAAVPRLAYEDQDLSACAEAINTAYRFRDRIPGVKINFGQNLTLRHFKSNFEFIY